MAGFYGGVVCLYDYIVLQVVRRCFAGRGRYGVLDRVGLRVDRVPDRVGWIMSGRSGGSGRIGRVVRVDRVGPAQAEPPSEKILLF